MRFVLDLALAFLAHDRDLGVICQPSFNAEPIFEQAVNALDDVVHDRLGCVINAAQFAQFRIIRLQKGFIEMNHRVATGAAFAEVFQNPPHVRMIERLN